MNRACSLLLTTAVAVAFLGCATSRDGIPPQVDLTTPEATVLGFTTAAATGQLASAMRYVHPEGHDHEDIYQMLTASPDSGSYMMKELFEAIDTDKPMPIVELTEEDGRALVVWRVTFQREFKTEKGPIFEAGSMFDLDATLRKSGDQWLIDGL